MIDDDAPAPRRAPPPPAALEYEPSPVRLRGRAWWRWWYGKGRGGSFAGCASLWAATVEGAALVVAVGLADPGPSTAACLLGPLAAMAAVCGLVGLFERETDKFFPVAGLALLGCEAAVWMFLATLFGSA